MRWSTKTLQYATQLLATLGLWLSLGVAQAVDQKYNASSLPVEELHRPLDFAVVGQAKCGTSSLWFNVVQNPLIQSLGNWKEPMFWADDKGKSRCDNNVTMYNALAAATRIKHNRPGLLVGDWSATYFSCACCPTVLKSINPRVKIVVVLRDPVRRALSRFVEQQRNPNFPMHKEVVGRTFADYAEETLNTTRVCLARADLYEKQQDQPADGGGAAANGGGAGGLVGYGRGMSMAQWMRYQCYHANGIVGWSVYDVFLENWLVHFATINTTATTDPTASVEQQQQQQQQPQLMVLYTDDLAARPMEVVNQVEDYLGVPRHKHDAKLIETVFNSHDCYHWRCGKAKAEIKPLPEEGALGQAVAHLVEFYRPHVRRLIAWGQQGLIAPPPDSWSKLYG